MKKVWLILSSFFLVISCNGQTNKDYNKMGQTDIKIKRPPKTITIESPVKADLKVYVDGSNLIGEVTLTNISDKDVILPEDRIGGRTIKKLKEENSLTDVFYAITYTDKHYSGNLTAKEIRSWKNTILSNGYIVLQPKQIKTTCTKLNKIFDLNEKKYDEIAFIFGPQIPLLDNEYKPIYDYKDSMHRPIDFSIQSEEVKISYNEIKDKVK